MILSELFFILIYIYVLLDFFFVVITNFLLYTNKIKDIIEKLQYIRI